VALPVPSVSAPPVANGNAPPVDPPPRTESSDVQPAAPTAHATTTSESVWRDSVRHREGTRYLSPFMELSD
jgi:hypothetical protein